MCSFQLEGEEPPPPLPPISAATPPRQQQQQEAQPSPPDTVGQSLLGPPSGSGGAEFLQQFVASAFDEMYRDEALSPAAMNTSLDGSQWREYSAQQSNPPWSGHHHQQTIAPSPEEQAWLDHEFDMAMECGEEASASMHSHSDAEEEEVYVKHMLAMHPALDEEEARWLYRQGQHLR
jgi:hypothetical protein